METGFRHKIGSRIFRILHLQHIDMMLLGMELVMTLAGLHTLSGIPALGEVNDHHPASARKTFSSPFLVFCKRGKLSRLQLGAIHHNQLPTGCQQGNLIAAHLFNAIAGT